MTQTSGLLTVEYNLPYYYSHERCVLSCKAALTGTLTYQNTFVELLIPNFDTIRYYLTSAGTCEIDIADALRVIGKGVDITLRLAYSSGGYDSSMIIGFWWRNGIRPQRVIIPDNRGVELGDSSNYLYPAIILQPLTSFATPSKAATEDNKIGYVDYWRGKRPFFTGGWSVKISSRLSQSELTAKIQACMGEYFGVADYTPTYTTSGYYLVTTIDGFISESEAAVFVNMIQAGYEVWQRPSCTISWNDTWGEREGYVLQRPFVGANSIGALLYSENLDEEESGDAELLYITSTKERYCGRRYAEVEWVDFACATRRLVWEVRDVKTSTINSVELDTSDNSYSEIKGREDSCTLYMENLSVYDMWYYADIIHSDKVRVTFDGEIWYNAKITTKDFTLPNSEMALQTLKVSCKFARYDAVNL